MYCALTIRLVLAGLLIRGLYQRRKVVGVSKEGIERRHVVHAIVSLQQLLVQLQGVEPKVGPRSGGVGDGAGAPDAPFSPLPKRRCAGEAAMLGGAAAGSSDERDPDQVVVEARKGQPREMS